MKKFLAAIGILGGICGIITGCKEWRQANEENDNNEEGGNDETLDEIIVEETTEEE